MPTFKDDLSWGGGVLGHGSQDILHFGGDFLYSGVI